MFSSISSPGLLLADDEGGGGGTNPGITPDVNAPWNENFLQEFGGQILGPAIVFLAISIGISVIIWAASSWGNSSGGQGLGVKGVVIGIVGAIVVGSAAGAITWFSGWSLF